MKTKLIVILTTIIAATLSTMPMSLYAQNDKLTAEQVDSIISLLPTMPEDSTKANALTLICSNHPNTDSTLKYTQELYSISLKTGAKWRGKAYRYLCWYCQLTGDYENAIKYGYKSLKINDSLNLKDEMALNYNALGECILNYGDYSTASDYFHKALNLLVESNNDATITYTYRNLGIIYINYKLYEEAMNYFSEAMKIDIANNNRHQIAINYYYQAFTQLNVYEELNDTAAIYEAKRLIELSKKFFKDLQNEFYIMNADLCQMQIYIDYAKLQKPMYSQQLIDSSLILYNEALNLADKNGFMSGYIYNFELCKAKYLVATMQYDECEKTLQEIENKAIDDISNAEGYLINIYQCYVDIYTTTGNYQKAIEYQDKLSYTRKRFYDNEFAANSIKSNAKDQFDIEMRNRDIELQRQKITFEERKKQMRLVSFAVCLFTLLLIGLAINLYKNNRKRHNTNMALIRRRENYRLQRSMLANANYEATSSIVYAKGIQTAILPTKKIMNSTFGDTLIIWNPVEIISGDFYWTKQKGRYKLLAVADCTGHGVPGAFMSMLGMTSLNDIVASADLDTTTAADILDELRDKIITALRQPESDILALDGMDIALCIIDSQSLKMHYAGAYRPLLIVRNGDLLDYGPDKMHLCYEPRKSDPFTNRIVNLQPGDTIYLFTDGFGNQFSNEERGMKFSSDRFKKLLRANSDKTFAEQKTIIEETMMKWRTSGLGQVCSQTDDQLLIGIKI